MIKIWQYLSEETKEYWDDYLILGLAIAGGLISFILLANQSAKQLMVILSMAVFYFVWGVVHHAFKKDLHFKVVLEYLLISLLGLVVFLSLIKRL